MKSLANTYRLPFDQHQRYKLLREIVWVLERGREALSIMEVGGYPPRLPDFLPDHEITIVDKAAEGDDCIRADARSLPFDDKSFDLSVSLDTLEHVMPEDRAAFVGELCRVARFGVVLAAPFENESVQAADKAIFEFIRHHTGHEHRFIKEHLTIDPPHLTETMAMMVDRGLDVQILPSGRLDRWMLMMTAYYTLDGDQDLRPALPFLMEAYNRAFYDFDKAEPSYRHFLIGVYGGLGEKWGLLQQLALGEDAKTPAIGGVNMMIELARTMAVRHKEREREALAAQLANKDEEIKALTDQVAALQDFMDRVKSLPLYTFYEKVVKPFMKK